MRALVLLACAGLVASAGCLGRDDPAPPTGTTPAPTPTPSTPEPTTPASPTPTTPPAPPARKVVYNGTHDFSGPPPAPGTPPRSENFTVDAGYSKLEIRILYASTSPAGDITVGAGTSVKVLDPAGQLVAECTKKDDPGCAKDVASPAAGQWKIEYAGSGTSRVTVTIAEA